MLSCVAVYKPNQLFFYSLTQFLNESFSLRQWPTKYGCTKTGNIDYASASLPKALVSPRI
jgi:hypothetical protein